MLHTCAPFMHLNDGFLKKANRIERFLSTWMQSEGVPGLSVVVVNGDEIEYSNGIGSRDIEGNRPATEQTLYGIGSCSKSFTAIGIMQLVEEGVVKVDDPLSKHLPVDLWEDGDSPVTIHELLTHTSGFPGDGSALLLLGKQLGIDVEEIPLASDRDFYRHLKEFEDAGERIDDRTTFFYNNSGWTLLGKVIEHETGMTYEQYIRDNILNPLGMERSTFSAAEYNRADNVLTPYLLEGGSPESVKLPFDELLKPAGGLLASVDELANYIRMYLDGGMLNDEQVLSTESIDRMLNGYVEWSYELSSSDNRYGYGWTISELGGEKVVSHIGDVLVSSAYLGFLPDRNIGIAVTANTSPDYIMQPVGEAILSIIRGNDPADEVPFFAVREKLSTIEGFYESYRGVLSAEVVRDGAMLHFRATSPAMMEFPLIPEGPDRDEYDFYTISDEGEKKPIRVDVDSDGNVDLFIGRWQLHQKAGSR